MSNIASPAPRALRDPSRASRRGITADPVIRACFAEFVARANAGKINSADEVAASLWPGDPVSRAVVRAAQGPGSTGDHGALIGASVGQFLSSLPQSAGAGILARCLDVQLAQGGSVLVPYDAATESVPQWVGEADPIPVNSGVTAAITIGPACSRWAADRPASHPQPCPPWPALKRCSS
ncbi:MAG: hypothetical protein U5N10_02130 [Gemmobacter sp.]|nr:hypothetical protein [Gemmobacter sp.]